MIAEDLEQRRYDSSSVFVNKSTHQCTNQSHVYHREFERITPSRKKFMDGLRQLKERKGDLERTLAEFQLRAEAARESCTREESALLKIIAERDGSRERLAALLEAANRFKSQVCRHCLSAHSRF